MTIMLLNNNTNLIIFIAFIYLHTLINTTLQ